MKSNFNNIEFDILTKKVGNRGKVRINKCGNLEVKFINTENEEWFVLYFTRNNKYLWRRHAYTYYGRCQYPLNMRRPTCEKGKTWDGENYYYRPYSVENSEFNTFNEAIDYFFRNYLDNFPCTKSGLVRFW